MYRLNYFKAVNVIGFVSGLGKKKFILDLEPLDDKSIIVITGSNATGKSTFASLIHPMHMPSDGRSKFIVPNKEGMLVRVYKSDDGSVITSKIIYKPKTDGGHTPKCYISITRSGSNEDIELNPNGNVSTYNDIVYTYFGINSDYINFASYSDAVTGFVQKNATERKSNVSPLVPNTMRFETAYNMINTKYRDIRNLLRNIAQRITSYRDIDSLKYELKQIAKDMDTAEKDKIRFTKESAIAGAKLSELTDGLEYDDLQDRYDSLYREHKTADKNLMRITNEIFRLYDSMGIKYNHDSIHVKELDTLDSTISKLTVSTTTLQTKSEADTEALKRTTKELSILDTELSELKASLIGLETSDIDLLESTLKSYTDELAKMEYPQYADQYSNLTYDGAISLSRVVDTIERMVLDLYTEYGQLVSDYYAGVNRSEKYNPEELRASITVAGQRSHDIYRRIAELEQYQHLQDILDKRPISCKIDSCPFITNALRWNDIKDELFKLKSDYSAMNISIQRDTIALSEVDKTMALHNHMALLDNMIMTHENTLQSYLDISVDTLKKSIANGTWYTILDMNKIKILVSILSDKDRYVKLTTELIPATVYNIKLAKARGTNVDMIKAQIGNVKRRIKELEEYANQLDDTISRYKWSYNKKASKLSKYQTLRSMVGEFRLIAESHLSLSDKLSKISGNMAKVNELMKVVKTAKANYREASDHMDTLIPRSIQVSSDIEALKSLREEHKKLEKSFMVVDVIRNMIQPGKGLRAELISLYMYEIYQTANQLLVNTFDGKLYLKEFVISDKEFIIPYVHNGSESMDISNASSSEQSTISMALSLAIISKLIDKYGIITIDEADRALSADNKSIFVNTIAKQMKYIGVRQSFIITHSPEYYRSYECGNIVFPGGKPGDDNIMVE